MNNHFDLSNPFFDSLKKVAIDVGISLPDLVTPVVELAVASRFGQRGLNVIMIMKVLYDTFSNHGATVSPPSEDAIKSALGWHVIDD